MSAQPRSPSSDQPPKAPQSALVLGGGFAGVETAIRLRRAGLTVTLVSERPHLFVYPTSIWVVTGEHRIEQDLMDLADVAAQHRFELVIGKVNPWTRIVDRPRLTDARYPRTF